MAGTVEDRSSYVRVHKIGAATAPGGRRTEVMPPPCFEDAFFFFFLPRDRLTKDDVYIF
jgi:hypothetical protein